MPVFVYRAADRRGQTIDGVMEAPDARSVVERLHKEAYYPIRVAPHAERRSWAQLSFGGGLRQRDLLTATQQLATLFEAGVPLDRALEILGELAPNPRIKAIVADLLRSVRSGNALSEALAKHHPRPFSRLYINMVRAGEKGGVLEVALRRLAEFLESRAAFTEAVVTALIYPAFVTVVAAGAVVFLMTFVLPRFASIFADLKQTIPLPTQIVLAVSTAIREYWWIGAIVVAAGVLGWRVWTGTPEGRLAWDRRRLKLPRFGVLTVKIETARFARTFGTMLQSGVPMTGALAVVGEMMSNQVMARAVARLSDSVKRGSTVAAAMVEHAVFPPLAVHMVRVGEETGRLEEMLLKTAETFENDVRIELKRAVSLIEIGVILVMGALVAFIVVAMLLAIFSINEVPL